MQVEVGTWCNWDSQKVYGVVQIAGNWEQEEHKYVDTEVYNLRLNGPLFDLSLFSVREVFFG